MKRIYESQALNRDDDQPFKPNERNRSERPQAMRTVPGSLLSRLFVPRWLRDRGLSIDVSTPQREYPHRTTVPFTVEITNRMPFPITVSTVTPLLWTWSVDGVSEASYVSRKLPDETRTFQFDRGERKRFQRNWQQVFRVSDSEWEDAEPGEYTISVSIDVNDPVERGLYAETVVRVVPD